MITPKNHQLQFEAKWFLGQLSHLWLPKQHNITKYHQKNTQKITQHTSLSPYKSPKKKLVANWTVEISLDSPQLTWTLPRIYASKPVTLPTPRHGEQSCFKSTKMPSPGTHWTYFLPNWKTCPSFFGLAKRHESIGPGTSDLKQLQVAAG